MDEIFVTVLTYTSSHKARYLKIRLEAVGIECLLSNGVKQDDSKVKTYKVMVKPEDVEKSVGVILHIKDEHLGDGIHFHKDVLKS